MKFFPPGGYKSTDAPLIHSNYISFSLDGENVLTDSTNVPLFHMSEANNAPENVEVNPTNDNYALETGTTIHRGSIVDKLKGRMRMNLTKDVIETDKLRQLVVYYAPVYFSFLNSLDAEDEKLAIDVENTLEMQHATDNKDAFPLYNGTDLPDATNVQLSTVGFTEVFGDKGLTTDAKLEGLDMIEIRSWFEQLKYFSNSGMLKRALPRWHRVVLTRERPFLTPVRGVRGLVKRGNPYMYCGIIFHLPPIGGVNQFHLARDSTDIPHINVSMEWTFEEWNTAFEQASI